MTRHDMEQQAYFDFNSALKRVIGNKKLLERLLNSFLNGNFIETLKTNIYKKDYKAAAATAHTIKGVCANLSLNRLCEHSKAFEIKLKSLAGDCPDNENEDIIGDYNRLFEVYTVTKTHIIQALETLS